MTALQVRPPALAAQPAAYDRTMQAVHWLTAALMIGVYLAAFSIDAASDPQRVIMLHRSLGVSLCIITILRAVWRHRSRIPKLPSDLPAAQKLAARANEVALYGLLILQPILGLAQSEIHGDRLVLFGGAVMLPALMKPNRPLAHDLLEVHEVLAYALLAAIGVHVAAALYHHLIRRDAVLSTMLPGLAGRRSRGFGTDRAD